ncbi:hypothetical protein EK21DRAFT_111710 [Setomelanomma holmii]|uniref:Uncharacterized protein n=1 Tax=Setomelanomma holmii TaxID=210430 RepID=A0A9P4LM73_9PLEO|nr:hypothetical protein EK21DRAFT_111710 [Setomelanomma holmii]
MSSITKTGVVPTTAMFDPKYCVGKLENTPTTQPFGEHTSGHRTVMALPAEDFVHIFELREIIYQNIASRHATELKDFSGFILACSTMKNESFVTLLKARRDCVAAEQQNWSTLTIANITRQLADTGFYGVERYSERDTEHAIPMGEIPLRSLKFTTYDDGEPREIDSYLVRCYANLINSTIARSSKMWKNAYGEPNDPPTTDAGVGIMPRDCPMKAWEISFDWRNVLTPSDVDENIVNLTMLTGMTALNACWKVELILEGTFVTGIKWARSTKWDYSQVASTEQDDLAELFAQMNLN